MLRSRISLTACGRFAACNDFFFSFLAALFHVFISMTCNILYIYMYIYSVYELTVCHIESV